MKKSKSTTYSERRAQERVLRLKSEFIDNKNLVEGLEWHNFPDVLEALNKHLGHVNEIVADIKGWWEGHKNEIRRSPDYK